MYSSYYIDDLPIYSVLDTRVEQVFRLDIDIPKIPGKEIGELIPVIIRIFPGQTEIKIETIIEGECKRLSFDFEQISDAHRQETEKLHKKKIETRPPKKGIVNSKAELVTHVEYVYPSIFIQTNGFRRFGSSFALLLGKKSSKNKT